MLVKFLQLWDCNKPTFLLRCGLMHRTTSTLLLVIILTTSSGPAFGFMEAITPFLETHCFDCHADGSDKGGLDFDRLGRDLDDPATFAVWERVLDRVFDNEMPPAKRSLRPSATEKKQFGQQLVPRLIQAHEAQKGTVLRRLNRREYENTMNDLFGTHLDLEEMLPEDGRAHEFDNVGEALGLSMTHLERYLEAARLVYDSAIARTTEKPAAKTIQADYRDDDRQRAIGKAWKELPNGDIVRFEGGGYPSGLLRESSVEKAGWYEIKVTGYAYQSEKPVIVAISGESYARGSDKPIYRYAAFPPGEPTTVTVRTWINHRYMLVLNPVGLYIPFPRPKDINTYDAPGFAWRSATIEGPLVDEFPSRGHQLIFEGIGRREIQPRNPADKLKHWYKPSFEVVSGDERSDAMQALRRVASRAWRRPVASEDMAAYAELFKAERADGSSFEDALRTAITALFVSPNFLYFREAPGRLDDYAVADRLSYFLSRTQPGPALLALAKAGQLANHPETLRAEADRLIADPRFERFLTDFTDTWLNLREMDFTAPDRTLYPEFDLFLRHSMPLETRAFIRELFTANLPVRNLVQSDFAMLNARLAQHYGLPPVSGPEIQRVALPPNSLRGGILSQGSILKVSANGTSTSPVMRGVFVLERLLGDPPKPPPPGISGVEPDIRGATTLRELLDKHRDESSCQSCHNKIDPPGFALEVFDPIGGERQRFRSLGEGDKVGHLVHGRKATYRLAQPVDASGQLKGETFADYQAFRELLVRDEQALAKAFVGKLLTFGSGREMGFSDRPEILRIVRAAAPEGYRIRDLLHLVVTSEIFLKK